MSHHASGSFHWAAFLVALSRQCDAQRHARAVLGLRCISANRSGDLGASRWRSAILGAFSPLAAFVIGNAAASHRRRRMIETNRDARLHCLLARSGRFTLADCRELAPVQLLRALAGILQRRGACCWRGSRAIYFLGSQLSWVLRPFIGNPAMPWNFSAPTPSTEILRNCFSLNRATIQLNQNAKAYE